MSGYAVEALLLARLDGRAGQWVEVADLAEHWSLLPAYVATMLDCLSRRGQVRVQRAWADGPVLRAMACTAERVAA